MLYVVTASLVYAFENVGINEGFVYEKANAVVQTYRSAKRSKVNFDTKYSIVTERVLLKKIQLNGTFTWSG